MSVIPADAHLFVITLEYQVELDVIDSLYDGHKAFLGERMSEGRILVSGPKSPRTGGVIIAMGTSLKEVTKAFAGDPFLTEGAATSTITEFIPRSTAPGMT